MDGDPWFWTVEQVSQFFRNHANEYATDIPNGRLPDMAPFLRILADNDVSGAILLTAVDAGFLRADCGIASLGIRSTLMYCISKLRAQSSARAAQYESVALPSAAPVASAPEASTVDVQQNASSSENAVTDHVMRDGEHQVEDAQGRKRRRLDLSSKTQPPPSDAETNSTPDDSGYLRDSALPVDEIFFGKTTLGQEIEGLKSRDGELLGADDADRDAAEDNFQFQFPLKTDGERHYVWSRVRHFLNSEDATDLQRHGRDAVAILPYPETLAHGQPQSAIVFQTKHAGQSPIAVRENAAFIHTEYDYNGLPQTSTSTEWDFLIGKYQQSDELPVFNPSVEEDISSSLADEVEAEEEERAREAEGVLTRVKIESMIDETIVEFVNQWRTKIPRLEEHKARSVWKRMKRSKAMRVLLTESATAKIKHLNGRLEKHRANYLLDEWRSEKELRATCEAMRATVEDREELVWMQDVWSRRQEPHHTIRRGHHVAATTRGSTEVEGSPAFALLPNDRFSLSPSRNSQGNDTKEDDTVQDFDLAVAVSELGSDQGFSSHDDQSTFFDLPRRPQRALSCSTEDSTIFSGNSPSSLERHRFESATDQRVSPDAEKDFSGSESLPDAATLSALAAHRNTHPETPAKSSPRPGIQETLIDLTHLSSDSTSPLRFPLNRPRTRIDYGRDPHEADLAEVKAWDLAELRKRQDRIRLVIKLLYLAGDEFRNDLHQCYRDLKFARLVDCLLKTVKSMQRGDPASALPDPDQRGTMAKFAQIAMAHLLCDADVIKRSIQPAEWASLADIHQLQHVTRIVNKILAHRDGVLFNMPTKTPPKPRGLPIVLSSDDDLDQPLPHDTPHKVRKRSVKLSETAAQSRTQAHERQERFEMAQKSQPSNSQELAAMIDTQSSKSNVIINPARDDGQEPIYIIPTIASKIKAHQIDGVQFMWREITNFGNDGEQGCVLAHTMGLGKTMQSIALLAAVNEAALSPNASVRQQLPPRLRPDGILQRRQLRMMLLSPPSLLQNWRREIEQWAPESLGNIFLVDAALVPQKRISELAAWHRLGGVLLISYNLFQGFVRNTKDQDKVMIDRILLHDPELVVADEVHTLKNLETRTAEAVSKLTTHSRIGLTGTPMSNDVQEIYAIINFVAPGYLGNPTEFRARFTEPIKQGTYAESSPYEVRQSLKKLAVLRKDIEPKVHRANITVLKGSLRPKVEFIITLPLMPLQHAVYDQFIDVVTRNASGRTDANVQIFAWLHTLNVLTNHPLAFKRKLLIPPPARNKAVKSRKSISSVANGSVASAIVEASLHVDEADVEDSDEEDTQSPGISEGDIRALIAEIPDEIDPALSAKMSLFIDILVLSQQCGDKVLAFSTNIPTLNCLADVLESLDIGYRRIDGTLHTSKRMTLVEEFTQGDCLVMLISTKAGATGLNMHAANRVVIFDFGFNPANEEQAIGRAYRLGQTKPVYVYRFVMGGTFEDKIYEKQLFKSSLSLRVVDKKNPRRNAVRDMRDYLFKARELLQQDLTPWLGKDPHVLDRILQRPIEQRPPIRGLSTMETLQEDAEDVPLNEEEVKEVNEEIANRNFWRDQGRTRGSTALTIPSSVPSLHASSIAPNLRTPPQLAPFGYAHPTQPRASSGGMAPNHLGARPSPASDPNRK